MSPSDLFIAGGEIILAMAAIFIALLALNLRRALVDRPYRARALWTAVGSLTLVSLFIASYADSIYNVGSAAQVTLTAVVVETIVWGFTFLGLYGWTVANADVAIQADYFNRDALAWKRVGRTSSIILIVFLFIIFNAPPWLEPPEIVNATGWGAIFDIITYNLPYLVAVYAAAVIVISYRRISDQRIKTYTKWVVASALSLFLFFISPSYLAFAPSILWIFCMYRSVGALAIRTRKLDSV